MHVIFSKSRAQFASIRRLWSISIHGAIVKNFWLGSDRRLRSSSLSCLLFFSQGIFALASGLRPGPWLETTGILLLANQSDVMESMRGSVGGIVGKSAACARYFVRQGVDDGNEDSWLVLLDGSSAAASSRDMSWTTNDSDEARGAGSRRMT